MILIDCKINIHHYTGLFNTFPHPLSFGGFSTDLSLSQYNLFQKTKNGAITKSEAFADNKFNVAKMLISFFQ